MLYRHLIAQQFCQLMIVFMSRTGRRNDLHTIGTRLHLHATALLSPSSDLVSKKKRKGRTTFALDYIGNYLLTACVLCQSSVHIESITR